MKSLPAFFLTAVATVAICTTAGADEKPAPGKQTAQSVEVGTSAGGKMTLHYWLSLPPESVKKPEGGWPVMFFMHGAGERDTDLEMIKKHGPPKLVGKMPELNQFIIISPQWPDSKTWWDTTALKGLIDHTLATQPVDKDRVTITGLSMGGYATWGLLAAHPDLAACAVPICGGGDPSKAASFKHVPIHCYHGAKDNVVPQKKSDEMIEALKKAGANPEYTIFPNAGHDSWTDAYSSPKLFEWMLAQKRAARK